MNTQHPLITKLRELETAGESGWLTFQHGEFQGKILLDHGLIECVTGAEDENRLGELLVKHGITKPSTLKRLLKRVSPRQNLGDVALRWRAAKPKQIKQLLESQTLNRLYQVLAEDNVHPESFEPTPNPVGLPVGLELNAVLLQLARRHRGAGVRDQNQLFALREEALPELNRFPWEPEELGVVSQLTSQPSSIRKLAKALHRTGDGVAPALDTLRELGFLAAAHDGNGKGRRSASEWNSLGLTPQVRPRFSHKLTMYNAEHAFISEQFRTLKVRINGQEAPEELRAIIVSSPFIREGKSLISTNLALACAEDPGRRVLLMDCDLRRSSVHNYLGLSRSPGVTDYLTQEGLGPQCFMRRAGKLYFMGGGSTVANPIELLSSERMGDLMEYVRSHFDAVIIDSPPLDPVSDARVLTQLADALILVVRSGKTSYASADRAMRNIDPDKLLGIVLNDVRPMLFNTYYGRHYYYSNGNGYPQIEEEEE